MTVIVINDFASITGGIDRTAISEASGLARRGHRVIFVAGHGEPNAELADAGVTVRITGQQTTLDDNNRMRAGARGIWNRTSSALVREITSTADPSSTVVHVHGFTKVLSASVIRAAVQSRLATVTTMHDYFAACPNGGFFNYQTEQICRLTPLSAQCVASNCDARAYSHKLWRVARTAVQRQVGSMPAGVGHFIVPSRFAANILRPYLPRDARVELIPDPIPTSHDARVDAGRNTQFVFAGRLQRDKGPIVFAEAARRAHVSALFAGAGEEAGSVRRAYPDAELTGWLDPADLQRVLRRARAVVAPSLIYETQGLTPLEAASHGVPTVVSDAGAPREAVADEVSGLWFRSGDVNDLADKLTQLQEDDELTRRLGGVAYERFWSGGWDLRTHLDRLDAVYRDALAHRRSRR